MNIRNSRAHPGYFVFMMFFMMLWICEPGLEFITVFYKAEQQSFTITIGFYD